MAISVVHKTWTTEFRYPLARERVGQASSLDMTEWNYFVLSHRPLQVRRSSALARHGGVELLCAFTSPFASATIVTGKIHFIKYAM
jgi:hypothetical protein